MSDSTYKKPADGGSEVLDALRRTAHRLRQSDTPYQWTHQGACNCGHLAQTLTHLTPAEIHAFALEKAGDWGEHAWDYCPGSGYPIDHIIEVMLDAGFTRADLARLERLSDPEICRRVGRPLQRNLRDDLIAYLDAWADLLEESCVPQPALALTV